MIRSTLTTLFVIASLIAGCNRREQAIGPPQVRYGETDCAQCGMSVADERYAAALIIRTADGEQRAEVFDDIGCMIGYEREHPESTVLARYVKDFQSHTWLPAEHAAYAHDEAIHSPMGFGLLAAESNDQAAKLAPQGAVLDLSSLRQSLEKHTAGVAAAGH
jgi:copper chaperone NosL